MSLQTCCTHTIIQTPPHKPNHSPTNKTVINQCASSQLLYITCLCLISSFFCSRKADGIPAMFSWALSNSGQRSFMNSRAFFPFRNPVKLICIIFPSGFCNTNSREEERGGNQAVNTDRTRMLSVSEVNLSSESLPTPSLPEHK